jgi:16S rRNA (cytosine967-C5)-methyltransferase
MSQESGKPSSNKPRKFHNPPANATIKTRPATLNLRAQVIRVIIAVIDGQSLSQLLPAALEKTIERDRGLFNELVMGTLRHWFALDAVLQPMLARPLIDARVQAALHLGLYQILQTRIPAHAAISETVDAAKQLGQEKASGLVNAILRTTLREQADKEEIFNGHHALPDWLADQLAADWGDAWVDIAESLRHSAPLFLRINKRQRTSKAYLDALALHGVNANSTDSSTPDAIQLLQHVNIPSLPGYLEGWFSVQDQNAQRCAALFNDAHFNGLDGKVVVDACAAPGGKTAHLLEQYSPSKLYALDNDSYRLKRVRENLNRLELFDQTRVTVATADAETWIADEPVDAILLDAPCSATGVLRRHPDIRLLRMASDIAQTVVIQAQLLDHLWTQLKVGGRLVYITCSLLKDENELQIKAFLARTANAVERPIVADWGVQRDFGRQCFPTVDGGDGFYFAVLDKV